MKNKFYFYKSIVVICTALCFLFILCSPSLFLAKGQTAIAGFSNPAMYHQRFNQGQVFTNATVPYNQSTNSRFYSYPGRLDNYSPNMRFLIRSTLQGASANPDHANLYQKSFTWTFYISAKNLNGSSASYIQDADKFVRSEMIVLYQDGNSQSIPFNISALNSGSGMTVTVSFSGFQDKLINNINLYLYFDFFSAFNIALDNTNENVMDLFIGNFSWTDTTPIVPEVPKVNLPNVDIDGLPNLDAYVPNGTPLGETLSILTTYEPILLMLIIPAGIGVVAYVLFGKR